jgi:hypothetical protein
MFKVPSTPRRARAASSRGSRAHTLPAYAGMCCVIGSGGAIAGGSGGAIAGGELVRGRGRRARAGARAASSCVLGFAAPSRAAATAGSVVSPPVSPAGLGASRLTAGGPRAFGSALRKGTYSRSRRAMTRRRRSSQGQEGLTGPNELAVLDTVRAHCATGRKWAMFRCVARCPTPQVAVAMVSDYGVAAGETLFPAALLGL